MLDLPSRRRPRFPPATEAGASHAIAAAIDRQLKHFDVGQIVAISSLARGGDILFQEHALARHLAAHIVLPFKPEVFLKQSVLGVNTGNWEARFWRIWNHTRPEHREILPVLAGKDPFERCNERQLEFARQKAAKINVIALFGGTADGTGGTRDLIRCALDAGGHIDVIDLKNLRCSRI
jgi:hypothetical protein